MVDTTEKERVLYLVQKNQKKVLMNLKDTVPSSYNS